MSEKYNPKKPGKDILTSDKTDFRKKKKITVTDKEVTML